MRWLYTVGVQVYGLGVRLASLWNPKARQWVEGRRALPEAGLDRPVWIHCASVGEFEQGRPIIESLKARHPDLQILLTFFSPSGYNMRKDYPLAAAVTYMPLDTPKALRPFLEAYHPRLAIFVKYEVWHNAFHLLHQSGVPLVMASAKFRGDQVYFKPWGRWFARTLARTTHIFTQDENSAELLRQAGIAQVTCAGDTRFDRVSEIAEQQAAVADVAAFKDAGKLLVAGSTWPKDEEVLAHWWQKVQQTDSGWKLLIVPHELHPAHLAELQRTFPHAGRWSQGSFAESKVLIADVMGMLSRMYRYADVAYVGGGFGAGIHNTLEPAVFGCPVIFGPRHQKFDEARGLIKVGGGVAIAGKEEFATVMDGYTADADKRMAAGAAAAAFVQNGRGATQKVVGFIEKMIDQELERP